MRKKKSGLATQSLEEIVTNIIGKTTSMTFWIAVTSSAVIWVAIYANWVLACLQLHRRPVPLRDDPKGIGGVASAMYSVGSPLTDFLSWTLVCATGLLILITVWPQKHDRRNATKKMCFCVGVGLLMLLIFKLDPWHVVEWYLD